MEETQNKSIGNSGYALRTHEEDYVRQRGRMAKKRNEGAGSPWKSEKCKSRDQHVKWFFWRCTISFGWPNQPSSKVILRCGGGFSFYILLFFMWHRLDHYWSNVYQTDHRFGCLLKHFVITEKVFWRSWMHTNYLVLELENTGPQGMWRGGRTNRRRMGTQIVLRFLHWKRKSVTQRSRNYLPKVLQTGPCHVSIASLFRAEQAKPLVREGWGSYRPLSRNGPQCLLIVYSEKVRTCWRRIFDHDF